ncbi:hypothetical protein BU23DRAFT_166897 [Bimuria novae-zelandiae CBS 107.79]|uniref:Uncharacterized protein n=1 Tax=Bimuria novae-zelandiae CBS 107.79 TaxID=1447943 RepID=A0A6A5V5M7_9PLEO|nr:hypothetical protein BU23DRAFT_166897 [Bimuria novae-zelandiae CBS 107.79]
MVVRQLCADSVIRLMNRDFEVDDHRLSASTGRWEYKLKDPFTGTLWEYGRWFAESYLKAKY